MKLLLLPFPLLFSAGTIMLQLLGAIGNQARVLAEIRDHHTSPAPAAVHGLGATAKSATTQVRVQQGVGALLSMFTAGWRRNPLPLGMRASCHFCTFTHPACSLHAAQRHQGLLFEAPGGPCLGGGGVLPGPPSRLHPLLRWEWATPLRQRRGGLQRLSLWHRRTRQVFCMRTHDFLQVVQFNPLLMACLLLPLRSFMGCQPCHHMQLHAMRCQHSHACLQWGTQQAGRTSP